MFLWRSLSPAVLLNVLAALSRRDGDQAGREPSAPAEPSRIARLPDRPARLKP